MRVAVDAMGGDHGPTEVVPGALAQGAHPEDQVILVGDEATVRRIAGSLPPTSRSSTRRQVIGMDEHPALALREKKDASILVAMDLVKRGEADAVVTAGHTGAGMAAAVLRLGRLPGVDRPALAVQMITAKGPIVLLDIGANPDSTAGEPRPVRADGRDLRRARPGRSPGRAWRSSRSARRRARATPGSSGRPSCSTRRTFASRATSRART